MPPPNDDLINAITLTGNSPSVSGTTVASTLEADEIANFWDVGAGDVWYAWTAPRNGVILVNLTSPTMDGEVDMFTGTAYTNFTFIDWTPVGTPKYMTVTGGVRYLFQVSYYTIPGVFQLSIQIAAPPSNDNFTQAQSITTVSFPISADNTTATTEIGEPTTQYNSMWYNFLPSSSGTLKLTIGNAFSSFRIKVFIGDILTELTPIIPISGSNNNITVPILARLNYKIVVYSNTSTSYGTFTLTGTFVPLVDISNDYFGNSTILTGTSSSISTNNTLATTQLYEDVTNYFSLWYSYVPTENGVITLTAVSGIPLNFKVYVGTDMKNAVQIDSGGSNLTILVQENVTYYIAVCSQSPTSYGAFTFSLSFVDELPFEYASGSHGISPSLAYKCSVRETGGRIWIGSVLNVTGISLAYSDDNGSSWVSANYTDSATSTDNRYWTGLFFDSNENIVIGYPTGTFNDNFRFIKRDKSAGTWTTYNHAVQGGSGPSLSSFQSRVWACQDNNGMIHVLRQVLTNYSFNVGAGTFLEGANNLYYFNFKDGAFSTEQQITNYSGYTNSEYNDTIPDDEDITDGHGSQYQVPKIISHNNQLLIFWTSRKYVFTINDGSPHGTYTRQILYSVLSTYTDLISAAHQWITGRAYKVSYAVLENGNYYVCNTAHTSTIFSSDIANWTLVSVGSITTPTTFWQNIFPYQSPNLVQFSGVQDIKSTGSHLYFIQAVEINNSSVSYLLIEDYADITPHNGQWGDWMFPVYMDTSDNDDLVLYGEDTRVFGGNPTVVVRRGGGWKQEHTDSRNSIYAASTYNFSEIK